MMKFKKLVTLMATLAILCFAVVGCGNVNDATDAKDNDNKNNTVGEDANNASDDAANAVGDVADGAADVVDDVADGVADMIDGSNGFDNYDDAHDYFLQQMGNNDSAAKYEVRNESRDVTSYDDQNEGYQFELYDTANNAEGDRKGLYYVDKKNGKIYQRDEKSNKVNEVTIKNANTDNKNTKNDKEDNNKVSDNR